MFGLRLLRKRRTLLHMGNAGDAVKTLREAQQLTQRELSKLSGVNAGYISLIENGRQPSARVLRALADALGAHLAGAEIHGGAA